jgi:hypothetical protein
MHSKQHNPIPAKIESPLLPCRILLLLTLFIAVWSPCLTLGQTWNGGGGNDNWTTGANWSVTPVAGNALTFGGTTRLGPVNDFAAETASP